MSEDQLHAAAHQLLPQDGTLIRVLAAVIRQGGRYLVCRRPAHKRHGGCWEFPGGKLEPGETRLEAARRELKEELDVEVLSAGESIFSSQDPGSPFLIEFVEVEISGFPEAREHDEIRWVDVDELRVLTLRRVTEPSVYQSYTRHSQLRSAINTAPIVITTAMVSRPP